MREFFGTLLDGQHFLKWLSKAVDYKLYQLENLVSLKTRSNRMGYSIPQQKVYDFWVQKSITSNNSTNNSKRVSKMSFFRDFQEITNDNVREEEKTRKKGSKLKMIVATKRIYTDSVRTFHKCFNEDQEHPISLTTFLSTSHFIWSQVKKRSKAVCVFIVWAHM